MRKVSNGELERQLARLLIDPDPATAERAFNQIYRRFFPRSVQWATREGLNPMDAEEAAQDTLLALWNRRDTVEPLKGLGGLIRVMTRLRARHARRGWLRDVERLSSLQDVPEMEATPSLDPVEIQTIEAAWDQLPKKHRRTLSLAAQGFAYREIAKKLRIAEGTVGSRLSVARAWLREHLAEDRVTRDGRAASSDSGGGTQ